MKVGKFVIWLIVYIVISCKAIQIDLSDSTEKHLCVVDIWGTWRHFYSLFQEFQGERFREPESSDISMNWPTSPWSIPSCRPHSRCQGWRRGSPPGPSWTGRRAPWWAAGGSWWRGSCPDHSGRDYWIALRPATEYWSTKHNYHRYCLVSKSGNRINISPSSSSYSSCTSTTSSL